MSTSRAQPEASDPISYIEAEVAAAETDRRAISRQMLADLLHERFHLPVAEAFTMVDAYCDERAPAVPHYLAEEFAIPYLKVVAVINVVISLGLYYWGIQVLQKAKQPAWPYFCIATIFVGLGALAWVKSLERFAARKRART